MVEIEQLVFGTVIAVLALIVVWRLFSVLRALIALWRRPQATATSLIPEETVSVEGTTFVEKSPIATDRLFDTDPRDIGSYVWRASFIIFGQSTYNFKHGEFRDVRRSFASGIETGRFGISTESKEIHVDPSWLCQAYDAESLSEVTIGEHRSNVSLPLGLSQRLFDSPYLNLTTIGECQSDQLTDILDVRIHENRTHEFVVEGRGIPAGVELFVSGTVRIADGRPTIVGTEDAPLLISDTGRSGLRRQLIWAMLKKTLLLVLVLGFGVLFLG